MFTKQEISLIKELTLNEFKLKYRNSILGFFWSLLKPLSMLTVLYIVFRIFIRIDFDNYALFLLLGIIIWQFFSESTISGLNSIVGKSGIVKKISFKYEIVIISACLSALLSFLLNFTVFLILLSIFRGIPSLSSFYAAIPVLELFLIALGLSFVLSIFFIRYRDVGHIWEILLQVGFWLTPIAYPVSLVPQDYIKIYMLNPLTRLITASREAIFNNQTPSMISLLVNLAITLTILCFGYLIYRWKYKHLVEYL